MKIYHSTGWTREPDAIVLDGQAQQYQRDHRAVLQNAQGKMSVSRGFGSQSAVLVLELPDEAGPDSLFPDFKWKEVKSNDPSV
jgi:hypothetical protein